MQTVEIFIDAKNVVARLTRVQNNLDTKSPQFTENLAEKLKRNIRASIPHKHYFGPGHNTPQPLQSYLHYQKIPDGHKVFFSGLGEKLAVAVDQGTRKHYPQKHNYIIRDNGIPFQHPGAKPTHFFDRAVRMTASRLKEDVKIFGNEIVNG